MHFSCGIVRPPYEAGSCFLQVTSGCSHNKCRFCTFYREAPFSVSPESEIREDLQEIRNSGWKVKRIFLQGADPFLLSYDRLKRIMDLIKEYLPWGVSVGGYGRVDSVRNKSVGELKSLNIRESRSNDRYVHSTGFSCTVVFMRFFIGELSS